MKQPRILLAALALNAAGSITAQCTVAWQDGERSPGPAPGIYGTAVHATAWWDPDGAGPAGPLLVIGGNFELPSVGTSNLATWDPVDRRWGAFPAHPNGQVNAIAVLSNGDLAIGGYFGTVGALTARRVAIWNGSSWSEPGGGLAGGPVGVGVRALLATPTGDLVVGGTFSTAGTTQAGGLARWDGSQWHAIGAFAGDVYCLAAQPNGLLWVGGSFRRPGGNVVANFARWNGSTWLAYGSVGGSLYERVEAIQPLPNGDLVVAGFFFSAGGAPIEDVARLSGGVWSAIGSGLDASPKALHLLPNGDLLVANVTTINQVPVLGIARWNGSQWSPYATRIGTISAFDTMPNGDLLVAGSLATNLSEKVRGVATWDGASWHAFGHGFDGNVDGLAALPNGDLVAYGTFYVTDGRDAQGLAVRTAAGWFPFAGNATAPWTGVPTCAAVDDQGALWMAGDVNIFPGPGNVARWAGSGWLPVGSAFAGVKCLAIDATGRPVAGSDASVTSGWTAIARWSGSQWIRLGLGLDGPVRALLRLRSGELIAAGEFLFSGPTALTRIARWDGTSWHPLGAGLDGPIYALAELPNGNVVAGGHFYADGTGVQPLYLAARWDGSAWQAMDTGLLGGLAAAVRALLVLPNGDLLAGGDFTTASGGAIANIARWDGSTWSPVDGGIDGPVRALALLPAGTVAAGGRFATAGGRDSAHVALLSTSCGATTASFGSGCAGSAGQLALAAGSLPWLGSSYRATCFGVSPTAIAAEVFGLQATQLPLSSLHPSAGAGCELLTSNDSVALRLPTNGAIATSVALPNTPALAGIVLHHQVLAAELTAGVLTQLASSNGLRLTVGSL